MLYISDKLLLRIFMLVVIKIFAIGICDGYAQTNPFSRTLPAIKPDRVASTPPGYCSQFGGSQTYESISRVVITENPNNSLQIQVVVNIANPTNCTSGEPCPAYDNSPEYVNVWIDWNGDRDWNDAGEKVMKVAMNASTISYSGEMYTPPVTVTIPPGASRPTWLRANLGWGFNPASPCTPQSWRWGDVKDRQVLKNLRVEEITAEFDIKMMDVPAPLWQAFYTAAGGLFNELGGKPVVGSAKRGWLTLPVKLISFPSDFGDKTTTRCEWKIPGTFMSGWAEFPGKDGLVGVELPLKVGLYDLELKFIFKSEQNNKIGEQIITMPLWVSLQEPQLPGIKKVWLRTAIAWVQGSLTEFDMAENMMHSIYGKSGWKYINDFQRWSDLVEGKVGHGLCTNMATVWMNLLKTLGLEGVSTVGHTGRRKNGFMTSTNQVAFGNQKSSKGNASQSFILPYDRWVFGSHFFGKRGTQYYDPTFDAIGADLYYHSQYDILKDAGSPMKTVDANGQPGPTVESTGSFSFEEGNWSTYDYSFPNVQDLATANKARIAQGAHFTGDFAEQLVDSDSDGVFDHLGAKIGIEITIPGEYTVFGQVAKDSATITARSHYFSANNWFARTGQQAGQTEVAAIFSGEDIFDQAQDGPFSMQLTIVDTAGAVVAADSFETSSILHSTFGELPARITQLSESARDLNNDGFFDELSANFEIRANLAGNYTIEATLFASNQAIAFQSQAVSLAKGNNPSTLALSGDMIAGAGVDGPYSLSLQVLDQDGVQTAHRTIETAGYTASQFSAPIVRITAGKFDEGIDIDSNDLFDSLHVTFNLQAIKNEAFTFRAWLQNQNGETLTVARSRKALTTDSESITLSFAGNAINASQFNGPYRIGYLTVIDNSSKLIFSATNLYSTQAYNFSQFETPQAPLVAVTGNFSDRTIDADLDGLIDSLAVEIELVPRDSGNVFAVGRLVDQDNETIIWSTAVGYFKAGVVQSLPIKFDGRYIYGNQKDGPFALSNLTVYHGGEPTNTIVLNQPYTTGTYRYTAFERAGIITGAVTDSLGAAIPDALLYITLDELDFSDADGKYGLVALVDSIYTVTIQGPDSSFDIWSVFVNGEFVHRSDSAQVQVVVGEITRVDFRSSQITAAPVQVTLPEWISPSGSEIAYPVTLGRVDGKEIYSADIALAFDAKILRPKTASTVGSIAESWGQPTFNASSEGQFRIAMAGVSALADSGALVFVDFEVLGAQGDSTHVRATEFTFNQGSPPVVIENGLFRVGTPTSVEESGDVAPETFVLFQNYPNPFNPSTVIRFQLPISSYVKLSIYNLQGQLVRTVVSGEMPAGQHSAIWDATDNAGARVASGVYVYVIRAGDFNEQRKLILMK